MNTTNLYEEKHHHVKVIFSSIDPSYKDNMLSREKIPDV